MADRKLTKEDILEGSRKRETVFVKEYGANVVIRPLTDGELSKIFSIIGPVPLNPDGTPDPERRRQAIAERLGVPPGGS